MHRNQIINRKNQLKIAAVLAVGVTGIVVGYKLGKSIEAAKYIPKEIWFNYDDATQLLDYVSIQFKNNLVLSVSPVAAAGSYLFQPPAV